MLNANDADYNFNNLTAFGTYAITNSENWDNKPSGANGSGFVICGGWTYGGNSRALQVLYLQNNTAYFRAYNPAGSSWQSWQQFSFDIPSFYKNYSTLAALAEGLGGSEGGIGIARPTSHYTGASSFKNKLQGLNAVEGVYQIATGEVDGICFGNTQMFVYTNPSGKACVDIRLYRNGEWGNKLNIYVEP